MIIDKNHNILKNDDYFLKPFTEKDIEDKYINWLNDKEVNKYLEIRFKKQTIHLIKKYINSFYEDVEKYLWGIYASDNQELIGTTSLYDISRDHGLAHISIMIGNKNYWGTNAALESKKLVINFAFNNISIRKIIAGSYSHNLGINFTLKKLGFILEAKLKKNRKLENGKYCDEYKWGLLSEEWQKKINK